MVQEDHEDLTISNPAKIFATSPVQNINEESITDTHNNNESIADDIDDADTWTMTSSQCDTLLSTQPPAISPTTSTIQKNVYIHDNIPKTQWTMKIKNLPDTIILADSNFRQTKNIAIPDNWEIHVYPGCAFLHASKILKTATIPSSVKNIVLAVGINHRGWTNKSTKRDWNALYAQTRSMKQSVHFLGISTDKIYESIKAINDDAKRTFGGKYIPALPEDQVTIPSSDPYKIHHNRVTVEKIIDSIKIHLN